MSQDREHLIRERAYAIWQAEGAPSGREQEHWAQAERDVVEDSAAAQEAGAKEPAKATRAPRKSAAPPAASEPPVAAPIKRARSRSVAGKPASGAAAAVPADRRGGRGK